MGGGMIMKLSGRAGTLRITTDEQYRYYCFAIIQTGLDYANLLLHKSADYISQLQLVRNTLARVVSPCL